MQISKHVCVMHQLGAHQAGILWSRSAMQQIREPELMLHCLGLVVEQVDSTA